MAWNDRGKWIGGFTQYPDYENRESRDLEDAIAAMHSREMTMGESAEAPDPIIAQVNLHDVSDKVYFSVYLGTADYKGEEMRVAITMGGQALLINFKGKQFSLNIGEVGLAIWEHMQENNI